MSRKPPLQRTLDAAVRPVNLVAPGVGAVAAGGLVVLGLPILALPVGALSLVTWGALVAWDVLSAKPPTPPPPEPERPFSSPTLGQSVAAIRSGAQKIRARIENHDGVMAMDLVELGAETDDLAASAERMARQGDALFLFLHEHDPSQIQREIEQRKSAARGQRDAEVAASLLQAAEAKQRQLDTWRDLRTLHDRIAAELVAMEAALDELLLKVVQLTVSDPSEAARMDGKVHEDLRSLRTRVQQLEQSAAATLREVT